MSLVAITLTPVPQTSARTTSPMCTGAGTSTTFNASVMSKIFPFGISDSVLHETIADTPPDTRTVEVTIRVGFVTSLRPYASPLGQVFPVSSTTSPFSILMVRLHPKGQPIQVNSLVSIFYASSILMVIFERSGISASFALLNTTCSISPGAITGRLRLLIKVSLKYVAI